SAPRGARAGRYVCPRRAARATLVQLDVRSQGGAELARSVLLAIASLALAVACSQTTSTGGSRPTPAPTVAPRTAVPTASGGGGPPAAAANPSSKQWTSPPPMALDLSKRYLAKIQTTQGDITVELFAREAPQTVNNFVFLAREGFYDNVKFHRIIKDFMIQTGDPTGTGTGSPGYRFADEPISRDYERGIVAMANS